MKTRIERRFEWLKERKRKGFIAYITAGDPTLKATAEIVLKLEDAGVDIVELGIPFSDPLADGRVNQQSAARDGSQVPGRVIRPLFRYSAGILGLNEPSEPVVAVAGDKAAAIGDRGQAVGRVIGEG